MSEKSMGEEVCFERFALAVSGRLVRDPSGPWVRFEDHQRLLYEQAERSAVVRRKAEKNALAATREAARLRDIRRFEAAKAAMQALIGRMKVGDSMGDVACAATGLADALLAELDRPREEPGPLHEDD